MNCREMGPLLEHTTYITHEARLQVTRVDARSCMASVIRGTPPEGHASSFMASEQSLW